MKETFRKLLMEGLRKFATEGYRSELELQEWVARLHLALEREIPSDEESNRMLATVLGSAYARELKSGIFKRVPGVSQYMLDRVAPYLRAELDKRIFASADLIRLRKRAVIDTTLQRFSGWVSSVPPEGPSISARERSRSGYPQMSSSSSSSIGA